MHAHPLQALASELGACLASGALASRGRVQLSDGVFVDVARMARIVLADFERVARATPGNGLIEGEEQELYDDLLRLHALALAPT
jgi:hypothetical protein